MCGGYRPTGCGAGQAQELGSKRGEDVAHEG